MRAITDGQCWTDTFAAGVRDGRPLIVMVTGGTAREVTGVLYRIESAKRDDTRAGRVETFAAMPERGETIYPQDRALDR